MKSDHTPEPWYWEAGSEYCPHGPEPEDDTTDAWDVWHERHTGSSQDVVICLDAPMGQHCPECSADHNAPVLWSACEGRDHARPAYGTVPNPDAEHQPVQVWVGVLECLDRECDEYFTDGGDEKTSMEVCSHVRTETSCSCRRLPGGDYDVEPCPLREKEATRS